MKTFWKLYYRITLGSDYNNKLAVAKQTTGNIIQSTSGKLNHFYNRDGAKIRGWKKPTIKFKNIVDKHPLELKYQ